MSPLQTSEWMISHRGDRTALPLADRHYNRQKVGSPQFVPPGRCVVLTCGMPVEALWVTSWPFAEYVRHGWAGAWVNSLFRRESGPLASELIRQAVAVTRYFWEPPSIGMITFVDSRKVASRNPGYCYIKAGFHKVGKTKGGLWAYQMLPHEMPEPMAPLERQERLFA